MKRVEDAYQGERDSLIVLLVKLATLVDQHDGKGSGQRIWSDVGDLERVAASVQTAIDVLEVD